MSGETDQIQHAWTFDHGEKRLELRKMLFQIKKQSALHILIPPLLSESPGMHL